MSWLDDMPAKTVALRAKRVLDVCVAGSGVVVLSPLLAGLAALELLYHGWPPLFVQSRPGLHGRVFDVVKFRTMTNERDDVGELLPDDERLTPFGKVLRSTSLDELPELLNVIRGEMSLVGPRPLLVEYLDRYSSAQLRRHEMPPGITGLAQINGRNSLGWEEKFVLDVEYVDSWSLRLDFQILAATVGMVVRREGISAADSVTMPVFQGSAGLDAR
ncbi:MAG: sugar transferase [Sandaracinaceae bacterium]